MLVKNNRCSDFKNDLRIYVMREKNYLYTKEPQTLHVSNRTL